MGRIILTIKANESSWDTLRHLFLTAKFGIKVPPLEPEDFKTDTVKNNGGEQHEG